MRIRLEGSKVKELLQAFYTLTRIRIVIFDDTFSEIMAYPHQHSDFCALIKANPAAKLRCIASDGQACRICRSTGRLYMYKCHAGLIEVAAPIKVNDLTLGYMMFGQIVSQENLEDAELEILERCRKYRLDPDLLSLAIAKLQYIHPAQITAASKIMESCASFLWVRELISVDEGGLVYRLANYIDQHLNGDLTVQNLCQHFGVSRTKLYEISGTYFGISIAKYVRKRRIEHAVKLLADKKLLIREVAARVGFDDYNYFSKVFKQEMGLAPTGFRKKRGATGTGANVRSL